MSDVDLHPPPKSGTLPAEAEQSPSSGATPRQNQFAELAFRYVTAFSWWQGMAIAQRCDRWLACAGFQGA
ncbi:MULTISPECIES: hypothetical protein [Bradyrhizobium]|uniref:hypothetical protein n=1 Tax=Bradyrhizobium TaxID=374 RepID=UPI001144B1E3|nr:MULTISPECIES: hypothetical protein [Bradyrhizobium]